MGNLVKLPSGYPIGTLITIVNSAHNKGVVFRIVGHLDADNYMVRPHSRNFAFTKEGVKVYEPTSLEKTRAKLYNKNKGEFMCKLYQFKAREGVVEDKTESEGVKQIRRNMAEWGRRQAKLLKNRDEINESAKKNKWRNPN